MTAVQRASTARLIAAKGQAVTITYTEGAIYSTATGGLSGGTDYTINTDAVLLPLAPFRKAGNSNIAPGDESLLIATIDDVGDIFDMPPVDAVVTLADGSKRVIVAIETLAPAGLAIMFDAVVRGYQ